MISVSTALANRHSSRAFLSDPVDERVIHEIFAAALRTASSSNIQPWRAFVLTGEALKSLKARVRESLSRSPGGEGQEFKVYPDNLQAPYNDRRIQCAEDLYGSIGVARENKLGRLMHFARNFEFYGAPVGVILAIDRRMEPGQWADLGMFLQSILLLCEEHGLGACAQVAWAAMHRTVQETVGIPEDLQVYCGVSIGHRDPDHPINGLVIDRAPMADIVSFQGFSTLGAA